MFGIGVEGSIIGSSSRNKKGVLEMIDDVKAAIREDLTLAHNRYGSSISSANAGTSFVLTNSVKYLSISIDGRTPSGYDSILCGESTLAGSVVASNIQTALRALGNYDGDGYNDAVCTFNNTTKQFTIESIRYGPKSSVTVTAGASNDCSSVLGFDSPTEVVGRNIVDIIFSPVTVDNTLYPVRYRVLPLRIIEEILV